LTDLPNRAADSQFRVLAQAMPNHVWAASPDGLLNWFNQRVYDYSGAAQGALDGAAWTRMVHPDDLEFAGARWNASLVSGAVYETEFRLRRADGVYRWHIARAVPIRGDAGAITSWVGTNTDIEDQKTALAELRDLNADLERRVIERTQARGRTWQLSPDLMGALNSQGYFETSNPAWQSMLGWSEAEVASMSIFALLHPDDVERTKIGFQLTQEGQPAIQFPNRYRCKDGSYRWISWVGVPEDGYVYCTGRDITADKQRDAELQNVRTFYVHSAECHAMLSQREDGCFEYEEINPATLALYGRTREEVIGRSVDELFDPSVAAALNGHLREALRSGGPHRYFRAQNGAGIEAVATPIPAQPGGRPRLAVTARDISERLGLEEQLRQAQKMEAVGQLTGGIAHDFNNLLQGITGALDRVQYRIAEGRINDVDRFLKAAIESANRAAALTHRLLAFSRRQTLDPKALDANKLIGGMEDLLRRTMGPNVAMEVVGAGGLWPVRVDPSQLESALLNLCINARDAMPDGGKLTIETANKWLDERAARERELPPGQYVSLCVTDTGTGMSEDVMARAFDPFFTTKPLGKGTGLGLSMIYGFVRQSGGQVRIYSEAGQGTTMCLYFPRHLGKVEEEDAARPESVERGFGETVLVVDDEVTVRMLVAEVLSESFYTVLEAGDGASALKLLESDSRVDLMITDVGLPGGMNGRQVADAARVLRPGLKVLFITGYAENAAIGNGHLDAGMEILAKPFAMSTLGNKVREMIEK
jgi:PAS domain S-box-containing protein